MNLIGGRQRILQPSFHIQKKKSSGLQRNLIFNQGGRGAGEENAEKVRTSGKNPGYAPD